MSDREKSEQGAQFTPVRADMGHQEMKHSDFKIGTTFYTATGGWLCTDVGTRTVVARKADDADSAEIVFDEDDFGGCSTEEFS